MKSDFLTIQPWMLDIFDKEEKKRGKSFDYDKAMIFIYILSYSRDGKSKWYGKQQNLQRYARCGESTICRKLKELTEDGYIIKETVNVYGMFNHNNYWVNPELLSKYIDDSSDDIAIASEAIAIASDAIGVAPDETNNNIVYKTVNTTSINLDNGTTIPNESEERKEVLDPSSSLIKNNIDIDKGAPSRRPPNIQIIPTKEEVREYFNKKGFKSNPDDFYDWYEAGDWKNDNGSFIKWKQKAIGWDKREYKSKEQRRKKYTNIPQTEITMEYAGEHNEL